MKNFYYCFLGDLILTAIIAIAEIEEIKVWGTIAAIILGVLLPETYKYFLDLIDKVPWHIELRKLIRSKELKNNDFIRISFAYLFRIKVNDKYLLVLNKRGTKKYQPVGGVYKYQDDERIYLSNKFSVKDDNRINIDESSQNDYRLFVPAKSLKKFVKRFDETNQRENLSNLSREFIEELINNNIVNFSKIRYRYCGRHFSKITYSRHFQCYELLMADIVELDTSEEQKIILNEMLRENDDNFKFATEDEIESCGISKSNLHEYISDHTNKILQSEEKNLSKDNNHGKFYDVKLHNNLDNYVKI